MAPASEAFDYWLRQPANRFNPGTTADIVTAALYAALREGTIKCPFTSVFSMMLLSANTELSFWHTRDSL